MERRHLAGILNLKSVVQASRLSLFFFEEQARRLYHIKMDSRKMFIRLWRRQRRPGLAFQCIPASPVLIVLLRNKIVEYDIVVHFTQKIPFFIPADPRFLHIRLVDNLQFFI